MFKASVIFASAALCLFSLSPAQAAGKKANSSKLCSTQWSQFQTKLQDGDNRLAFQNPAGPLGIGLCWWHSRMQRNANYLLDFKPSEKRASDAEVWTLIKGLTKSNAVQVVKGYKNLQDFSSVYSDKMAETLGQWQLAESFLQMGFLHGIGSNDVSSSSLQKTMDALYAEVKVKKNVPFQMLKMGGVATHAWLVTDMTKNRGGGYTLQIIDSNVPWSLQTYEYVPGMTQFSYNLMSSSNYNFVPYTQHESDLSSYQSALKRYCK
jgi:hypothetical protein